MRNNDFSDEEIAVTNKRIINKKNVVIILFIFTISLIGFLWFNKSSNIDGYFIKFEAPSIIYVGEPVDILVELKGPDKYLNESTTSYYSEKEGIIYLPEDEFYGKNGSIFINPVSVGEDSISIASTIGADRYTKELATKTMQITVCPKFDNTLVKTQTIVIKKGFAQNLGIDFGPQKCSEIVTYKSSNPNIAVVSEDGIVSGKELGKTSIVVSNGSSNITIDVNIIN